MRLKDYLQKHKITQAAFGRRVCPAVSQGKVNHWINGTRRVSLAEALQIEALTAGEVAAADLLPPDPAPTNPPAAQAAQQGVS
jgi:DNA-binding transcriptional regulator YdaS (Cro superfamily)